MSQVKPPIKGPKTSGKATASLILGIVSFIGMCFTGIIGLILGIMALGDISKSRGMIGGKGMAITGIILSSIGILWTLMAFVMIGMLLPAVQQVREAARRVTSMNNMRQHVLAMHNYESAHREFPKSDMNGLSWRVHLLPFLEMGNLYDQFNLDEPWNSPHNIALLDQMPPCYDCPSLALPPGMTVYQVPFSRLNPNSPEQDFGWASMFDDSDQGVSFADIPDGTSFTIAILEVDQSAAVEWTRPADWEFDPNNSMHDLGNVHPGIILIGTADGAVQAISNDTPPEEIKSLITRAGGEIVQIPY